MNEIEKYVNNLVRQLGYPKKEQKELYIQFIDHIVSLKDDYLEKGYSEDKSIELAISDFGSKEQLHNYISDKPNENYFLVLAKKKNTIVLIGILITFLEFWYRNSSSEGPFPYEMKILLNMLILVFFLKIIYKYKRLDKRIVIIFTIFSVYIVAEIILGGIRFFNYNLYDYIKHYYNYF